ncbi:MULTISPECIES: hypothetical protein [unclassified Mycolicibacterium]|uniref:hypothetical protein n=1 Tax=unclassified Mycolicibacterium TaxID=2636767 RepID=UPI002ED9EAF2
MAGPYVPNPVPEEHLREWKGSALMVRTCNLVLKRIADPTPTSALAAADVHYPQEKVSAWSREYLLAGADSLNFWADHFSPFEFAADAVNEVRYRPYLLLARSGLESAAHGLWTLSAATSEECAQRHVRLLHRDFRYHRKALEAGGRDASHIQLRIDDLEQRAKQSALLRPTDQPPGYEALIRHAADIAGRDADEWAFWWNAASGAAHGQNWLGIEGYQLHGKSEYEPGHFRVAKLPDPEFITNIIDAASSCLLAGTVKWLGLAGHSMDDYAQAQRDVFSQMPKST